MSIVVDRVLTEVYGERLAQDKKWGEQNHPDGTNSTFAAKAKYAKHVCDQRAAHGLVTWRHILNEEVSEAFAEDDPAKLRAELIQVAAVAVAWVEAIDRRADK